MVVRTQCGLGVYDKALLVMHTSAMTHGNAFVLLFYAIEKKTYVLSMCVSIKLASFDKN